MARMKIVHSYYTKPWKHSKAFAASNTFGWLTRDYHYFSWTLTSLQYLKHFGNIHLVTDKAGKELLIDTLKLPYSSVSLDLEYFEPFHPDLWIHSKLYVYSMQTEPFLHVDGDAFIWKRFDEAVMRAPFIACNREAIPEAKKFYQEAWKEVLANFSYIPPIFNEAKKDSHNIVAYNAGVIGANDIGSFSEYVRQSLDIFQQNIKTIPLFIDIGRLGCFVEQHLLHAFSKEHDVAIKTVLPGDMLIDQSTDCIYNSVRNYSLLHPISLYKKHPAVCELIECTLRQEFPESYYRVRQLIHQHLI